MKKRTFQLLLAFIFSISGITASLSQDTFSKIGASGKAIVNIDDKGSLHIDASNSQLDTNFTLRLSDQSYILESVANDLTRTNHTNAKTNKIIIPKAEITKTIYIKGGAGDDILTIDLGAVGRVPAGGIVFNGGFQNTEAGDALNVVGGRTFDAITYDYTEAGNDGHNGTIDFDGGAITFTGLEPVAVAVSSLQTYFFLPAGDNPNIVIGNHPTAGRNVLTGDTFEDTEFVNPVNELSLSTRSGDDVIEVRTMDDNFNADFLISGGTGADTVKFVTPAEVAFGTGDLFVTAENIIISTDLTSSGFSIFWGFITMTGNVTVNGPAEITANRVRITGLINGANDLSIQSFGSANYGAVGALTPLNSFKARGSFSHVLPSSITTQNNIEFTGNTPVIINSSDLRTLNNGDIIFNTRVEGPNSPSSLLLNTGGIVQFKMPVGGTTALGSILTDAGGATEISGSVVTTANQNYLDELRPLANASLNGATISTSGINSAFSLTVNATSSFNLREASTFTNGGNLTINAQGIALNAPISLDTGLLTLNNSVTSIFTPAGVLAPGFITADVNVSGQFSPGNATTYARLPVAGNLTFTSSGIYVADIGGIASAGLDFDQIDVSGTLDVSGASLNLINQIGTFPANTELVIIQNDGTDDVIGNFASNNLNSAFFGQPLRVIYDGGDGNDVAISSVPIEFNAIIGDGANVLRLVVNDQGNGVGVDDEVEFYVDGTLAVNELLSSLPEINVTGAPNENDTLEIDFSGGLFNIPINYEGGSAGNDVLELSNGGIFAIAEYNFDNENDGNISLSGNGVITYTGLEPIISTINATDVILNYSTAAETITTSAGIMAGQTTVDSTDGEVVTFNNPTNSLRIDPGAGGANSLNIEGVGIGFNADFFIMGNSVDTVTFQNNDTNIGSGSTTVSGQNVIFEGTFISSFNGSQFFNAVNGGNITFGTSGKIEAGAGTVNLYAETGAIICPSGAPKTDVQALSLDIITANGIGSLAAIETQVVNLSFDNRTAISQTNIDNTGALIVSAASNFGGGGTLEATGSINVNAVVTSDSDFTINSTASSLTINSNIIYRGAATAARTMDFLANDDISIAAGLVRYLNQDFSEIMNITTTNGAIIDTSSGTATNFEAGIINLSAVNGIGAGNDINTRAILISYTNTNNNVEIRNFIRTAFKGTNGAGLTNLICQDDIIINAPGVSSNAGAITLTTDPSSNISFETTASPVSIISDGGAITLNTDNLIVPTSSNYRIDSGSGLLSVAPIGSGNTINIGAGATSGLAITDAELDRMFTSGGIAIGSTTAGSINVSGISDQTNGTPSITGGSFNLLTGNGAITISEDFTNNIPTLITSSTGNVVFDGGTVTALSQSVSINAGGSIGGFGMSGLDIVASDLNLTAANGIGNTNAIETNVDAISYTNTTTNRVQIIEADNVTLTGTDNASSAFDDIRSTNGNIDVIAPGVSSTFLLFLGASAGNVTTPVGIPTNAILTTTPFSESQIGGTFQPGGTGIGVAEINGRFRISSAALNIQINDTNASGSIAGTDYDAITLTSGNAFVDNATLTVTDLGSTELGTEPINILTQQGGGAISGTFAGLEEGVVFSSGGQSYQISYVGGNGNDITLTPIDPNDPVLNGTAGNDAFIIFIDGTEVVLMRGATEIFRQAISITDSVTINSGGGNDSLATDFSGGNFPFPITFNGEGQTGTPGDSMTITGGGTFTDATFNYVNANDGSIDITGNNTISYTGLEPITSTINATNVILNYSNANQTIAVTDAGGGQTTVDSTAGEITTFNNPTGALTINSGGAEDTFVNSLASNYPGDLIINGDTNTGVIRITSSSLTFDDGTIDFIASDIVMTRNITTVSGDIIFNGRFELFGDVTLTGVNSSFGSISSGLPHDLILNFSGNTIFNGITDDNLNSLTTDAPGTTTFNNNGVLTNNRFVTQGSHTYNDVVGINTNLTLEGSNITFNNRIVGGPANAPVDGTGTLTINTSGTTTFNDLIGRNAGNTTNQRINNLTTDAAGTTVLNGNDISSGQPSVSLTGNATFNDPTILAQDQSITTAGSIVFNNTLESQVNGGAGINLTNGSSLSSIFNAEVGSTNRLRFLATNTFGSVQVNTPIIHTTGSQSYFNPVEVNPSGAGAITQMDADSGNITFNSTLRGTNDAEDNLVLSANNIMFNGAVGDNSQRFITLVISDTNNLGAPNVASNVPFASTLTLSGGFLQRNGTGTTTFNGGTFGGAVNVTTGNVVLNSGTVDAGGNAVTFSATTIETEAGISPVTDIIAATVNINGTLAPGASPGQLVVNGNLTLDATDTVAIEIDDYTMGGTDYDQVIVNGVVTLDNATLNIIANTATPATPGDELLLIDNDGADPVVGTFNGLPEGTIVVVNGEDAKISYVAGDGNDVTLRFGGPTIVSLTAGQLLIEDTLEKDDDLTITYTGSTYIITDNTGQIITSSVPGTTGNGTTIVTVPDTGVTTVLVTTLGGDDSLTTDFSGGNFLVPINYDGGNQNSSNPGDVLAMTGGASFNMVTHTFVNESNGNVMVTGNSVVNYIGLEPITDNLSAMDRVFNFTGGAETITLQDATGTAGSSFIDSTLGESVTFANPAESVTINAGSGDDIINIEGVDAAFNANLSVNGDDAIDRVNFQTNETTIISGDISVVTERIEATQNITTTGNISFTTDKNIDVILGSVIQTTNGNINFQSGLAPLAGDGFTGIIVNGATVQTTGTGNISLTGTGFGVDFRKGVEIAGNANVLTSGSGSISINGFGATVGNSDQAGITLVNNVVLRSNGGGITLNGTGGGDSLGIFNDGVAAFETITIEDLNGGDINITGTGGLGEGTKAGIYLGGPNVFVRTTDGNIEFNGAASPGIDALNDGVLVEGGTVVQATGTGMITINGAGGAGISDNTGVTIFGTDTMVTTNGGGIVIDGTSAGSTGNNNYGVSIADEAQVSDTANGVITITGLANNGINDNYGLTVFNGAKVLSNTGAINMNGTGGNGSDRNIGLFLFGPNTSITSTNGDIILNGTGGNSTGNNNEGFTIAGEAIVEATNGAVTATGTATGGANLNKGIVVAGFDSAIKTNGGGATLTGTGAGTGNDNYGIQFENGAFIEDTATGSIVLNGTGGNGVAQNQGIRIDGLNAAVRTVVGDIILNGTGGNGANLENIGIIVDNGVVATTGTGDVILNGSTTDATVAAINMVNDGATVTAGGTITANATTGKINTPAGIPTTTTFTATETIINGVLAPGQSPGQLLVAGDFTMAADDTYEVEVDDFNTAGTDYDQVAVTGVVDITGATLTLVDNTAETGELCDQMTIIDNDGTDAIIGEFVGLPEATDISFNGELWRINYAAGDGNDVVLAFNPGMVAAPICQAFTAQLDANGEVTITPADVDGGTPMGCDFDSLAIDIDMFTCADLGDNDVVLTVTDIFGNTNTCTAVVTVEDSIAPIIGCPADVVVSTDPNSCLSMVQFANPSVIENCGTFTITQTVGMPSGSLFPIGINNIGFSVTDGSGNVSTCSFTITVEDNTDPVAVCQDITVQLDESGSVTISAADINNGSTDNCNIMTTAIDIDTFDCNDVGDNTVTLTVTDRGGNTSSCTATVTVEDVTAPVVVCQDITVQLGADGTVTLDASLLDGGSTDACGIDSFTASPATLDCSNIGSNTVTLTVTDVNGNSSTCEATVEVEDTIAPTLVCQPAVISLGPDGTATVDPTVFVDMSNPVDNCETITYTIDVSMVDCDDVGTTIDVTIFADDGNGNFASCMTTMTVEDVTGPVFDASTLPQGPITRFINPATGIYRMENFRTGVIATDDCSLGLLPITLQQDPPAGTELGVGVYDVTITAVDDAGNMTDYVFELRVEPTLGTGDVNLSTLVLYPNPMKAKVILSNPNGLHLKDVSIFDLQGRLVQKVNVQDMTTEKVIDISQLQAASYVFVITGESGTLTKTMIKE